MQALTRRFMLVLVAIALLGGTAGMQAQEKLASPESVGFSADGLRALQRTMRALVDDGKLAGVTTLVARHGKVVHLDAYGVQDPHRVDDQADRGRGHDDALGTG